MNRYCLTDYGVKANSLALQTKEIQAVLDLCKDGGGTVVVPKGKYYFAALRMWSNTTLYLQSGAELGGRQRAFDGDYEKRDGVFP